LKNKKSIQLNSSKFAI